MFIKCHKLFRNIMHIILLSLMCSFAVLAQTQTLHIYNWSDFIAPDTIPHFEKQTNTKVTYDVYDSNEILDGKLMSGNTGFDLVAPTDSFLARQIQVGIYLPLDKQKLPNYAHLDEKFMQMMTIHDPNNTYAIPYLWQSTGIGYNVNKVKAALGDDVPLNSWDLVFKIDNLQKLSKCGVAFLDAPSEMFPTVLNYLGKNPNSKNSQDYELATKFLETLRPYVTYFHNSKYINDLSGGDICVAIGWSGDMMQAADVANEAKHGVEIGYIVPKEGAIISFDVWAIPKDAKNIESAYTFLNYLLQPEIIASISNHVFYPSANKDATPYLDADVRDNPSIFPSDEVIDRLFPIIEQSPKLDRLMVRLWSRVLSGK